MDTDALFAAYYTQYLTQATIPNSTDDEYTIFEALANEAINRWANYDATFWKELYSTLQTAADGTKVIAANLSIYPAPTNMRKAGGFLHLLNSSGTTQRKIKIIEPQDAQFKSDNSPYCFFTGNPNTGFSLTINGLNSADVGLSMNYVYYKKPTLITTTSSFSDMSQPYFIVHRALANRFRGSRNPYYQSAKNDAEDVLTTMKMENDSGNWADPWMLEDHSGSSWGR